MKKDNNLRIYVGCIALFLVGFWLVKYQFNVANNTISGMAINQDTQKATSNTTSNIKDSKPITQAGTDMDYMLDYEKDVMHR